MKNAANGLTGLRAALAAALLFLPMPSIVFTACYLLAGLSDMLDGPIARHFHAESRLGAALDGAADAAFLFVMLLRLLPHLTLPGWLLWWIAGIAALRIGSLLSGLIKFKRFLPLHTWLNKAAGFLLFCYPLLYDVVGYLPCAIALCGVATLASMEELGIQLLSDTPADGLASILCFKKASRF